MRHVLLLALIFAMGPAAALAETLVATRTIRPQQIIMPEDVAVSDAQIGGMFTDPAEVVGQEARVALFAGRPIGPSDIGPPALVDRNQIVILAYRKGPVTIVTEGRALGRGGVGDRIRVMNLGSRATVSGYVTEDGSVRVLGGT